MGWMLLAAFLLLWLAVIPPLALAVGRAFAAGQAEADTTDTTDVPTARVIDIPGPRVAAEESWTSPQAMDR